MQLCTGQRLLCLPEVVFESRRQGPRKVKRSLKQTEGYNDATSLAVRGPCTIHKRPCSLRAQLLRFSHELQAAKPESRKPQEPARGLSGAWPLPETLLCFWRPPPRLHCALIRSHTPHSKFYCYKPGKTCYGRKPCACSSSQKMQQVEATQG